MKLTRNMILENPGCITRDVTMASGAGVVLRVLSHSDDAVLGRFFEGLFRGNTPGLKTPMAVIWRRR
mgnify:CR=1 FL=1|tara:strand:- start:2972 stop:3172 length:201 start_codon:yes stop_codon:yes gene_type:complete